MPYRVCLLWLEDGPVTSDKEEPEPEQHQGELPDLYSTWDAADIAGDDWRSYKLIDARHSEPEYTIEYVDDGSDDDTVDYPEAAACTEDDLLA